MHRIDHATRLLNANGTGKDGFTEGSPVPPVVAKTTVTDDWLNDVQETLGNAIESAGISLVKNDFTQLISALRAYAWRDILVANVEENAAPGGATATLNAIAHDGVKTYLVAGDSGEIHTSMNGARSFTRRTAAGGYAGTFYGAAYGASKFVIVGTGGEIQTSSDNGATWVKQTPAASFAGTFFDIIWVEADAQFVIVGTGGEIQTSPDGLAWTKQTNPDPSKACASIAWGAGTYVIRTLGPSGFALTSSDALAWVKHTTSTAHPTRGGQLAFGTYGGVGRFVCVSENNGLSYSLDAGATWTSAGLPPLGRDGAPLRFFSVAFDGDHFVAMGANFDAGGDAFEYAWTRDGQSWIRAQGVSGNVFTCYRVAYVGGLFLGACSGSKTVRTLRRA